MFKKVLVASLAAAAVALNAPIAGADPPIYDCDCLSAQQEDATGQAYEGVAYGYIVHVGDPSATIRCYIVVNRSVVWTTPTSRQNDTSGQNFEGAAFGYLMHPRDDAPTIRCYIAVNGVEASSTAFSQPTPVVSVATSRLQYLAGDTDVITFHAVVFSAHGCNRRDYETERSQIPPQEVIDALGPVVQLLNDHVFSQIEPNMCPILGSLADTYGPVAINPG